MRSVAAAWITDFLGPGRALHDVGDGLLSALEDDERVARYDRQAAAYDRLVGNSVYNRLVWGTSPACYAAFAASSVADSGGPLLDVGCGTALFTAASYRATDRPLVLVDRSLGMLRRAAQRLDGHGRRRVALVQADVFDLPFQPALFATVACHGLLHIVDDAGQLLRVLRSQAPPAGSIYATSLVAETAIGTRALRVLHRIGEATVPRREDDLATVARQELGDAVQIRREGSMAFLRREAQSTPAR